MCSTATLMNRYGTPQMAPISPNSIQARRFTAGILRRGAVTSQAGFGSARCGAFRRRHDRGGTTSSAVSVVSCSSVGASTLASRSAWRLTDASNTLRTKRALPKPA